MGNAVIYHFSPYGENKNFGQAANHYCSLVPNGSWIAFRDGDAMFLDAEWGNKLQQIIEANPDGDIFGCITNRLKDSQQLYQNQISDNPDILYHKEISDKVWQDCGTVCVDAERPIAGMFLVFKKEVWKNIKFHEGLWGCDFLFSREAMEAGYKIKIALGLYCFHYYRLKEGKDYYAHLV